MSLFFAILLSKSLILAVSYGTDCSFHLYNVGQFHVKKKINKNKNKKIKIKKFEK